MTPNGAAEERAQEEDGVLDALPTPSAMTLMGSDGHSLVEEGIGRLGDPLWGVEAH